MKHQSRDIYVYFVSLLVLSLLLVHVSTSSNYKYVIITISGTIISLSPLHADGRYLRDAKGNIVMLYAVNKPGFEDEPTGWWNPYSGGWYSGYGIWNETAVKQNLDYMRKWGANCLILIDVVEWWHYDTDNHKRRIKNIIQWAEERGLYVIYEQTAPLHDDGTDNGRAYLPYPPYKADVPEYRLPEYQAVLPDAQAFINNRIDIARELKEFPNVLITMWGEPLAYYDDSGNWTYYWSVVQQAVDGMRAVGFYQPIILTYKWDTSFWDDMTWAFECPVTGTNLVYGIQIYPQESFKPTVPEHPDYNTWYQYDVLKSNLEDARILEFLESGKGPIICLETGLNYWLKSADVTEFNRGLEALRNLYTIFNEWGISYGLWWWRQGGRYDIFAGDYYTFQPNEVGEIFINSIK